ncbi:GTP 3',8-cyclase MoaA [Peptostreptococcus equinus]|uniref:GTP 3',8-cyclase n=1 Tax=Peptostreptococcus equinus TaxID=3003601 RepID=A0ABY7JRV9_9FIRM|nr:GTP 3',8-cyclase MoaA [Peptostreptococcus sp. CBA3647]WAW15875.1 GTP 3',8-cyclase MoaA [Peptostreptococcus sp. CBA3647]
MIDSFNRNIDYMRISVTDRCNLRCRYCMPDGIELCSHDYILSFDEILMVCKEAIGLGIVNFKITGGEPLVRKDCHKLIKKIYELGGVNEVTITTNGILLVDQLDDIIDAGVKSINISLDTLDREKYEQITGFDQIDKVLEAIEKSVEKGIRVKINSVLHDKDYKEDFLNLIKLAQKYPIDVRFIEMMPIGLGANSMLVSNEDLKKILETSFENVSSDKTKHGNGPAEYCRIDGFLGAIGFISAMHGKFCDSCNRIRMTSTGEIKSCLCFDKQISLKDALKARDSKAISEILKNSILEKPEMHCFEDKKRITELKRMTQIGG